MINLIIDAANEKIFFKIINNDESYTSEYINNRENFDKLIILIFKFLDENRIKIKNINFKYFRDNFYYVFLTTIFISALISS